MNVLLCSVGRRPYLVRWFQEALAANSVRGSVIAADHDPTAPTRAFADRGILAPPADDPRYRDWLAETLAEHSIDLAISINDFELSQWGALPADDTWEPLVRLPRDVQWTVEDKYETSRALERYGISSPRTWLGSAPPAVASATGPFVTKGRYGSASRGLQFIDGAALEDAVVRATRDVTTRQGVGALEQTDLEPADLVVIQEEIVGVEFGIDVVCDLDAQFAGVLARRKTKMRSGETDRAVSVDPAPFVTLAQGIAKAIPHPGTIDVDVIVNDSGHEYVIDINPRFGGGYPFSHLAGARVPHAYVAWKKGLPVKPEWLTYDPGVVAGKYVEIARIQGQDADE